MTVMRVGWRPPAKPGRSSAGTVIIQQGVPVDSVFIVIDGQLQVYSGSVEIAKLLAGEIVGEISFVDSRPPSASVKATVDSQVLAIPKAALRAKLQKDLGFASRFYLSLATFLADRLRVADARLTHRPERRWQRRGRSRRTARGNAGEYCAGLGPLRHDHQAPGRPVCRWQLRRWK